MKKIISFIAAFSLMFMLFDFPVDVSSADALVSDSVAINETNFPDVQFRNFIKQKFDMDKDDSLSADERGRYVTVMCPSDEGFHSIKSFKGLEFFNELIQFEYDYSEEPIEIDFSQNPTIQDIFMFDGSITGINVSNCPNLKNLRIENNNLSSIDVSQNTDLEVLTCQGNKLTSLDVSANTKLTELNCGNNPLSTIDVTRNTALQSLSIDRTSISSVDISQNTALTFLNIATSKFTDIDLKSNTSLKKIYFKENKLTSIDFPNETLVVWSCGGNSYDISVGCDRRFDLSSLSGNFDVSKTYDWVGGTLDGTTLIINEDADEVTYKYTVISGNIHYVPFKLIVKADEHQYDNAEIVNEATCTEEGTLKKSCTVCGKEITETIEAKGHTFSEDWSKDETYHWHEAVCEHKSEVNDKAEHSWNEGETDSITGDITYTCSVCNETKINKHTHSFSEEWSKDETYHWHEASCGHDVTSDKAEHTWNNGEITTPATETTDGVMTYTCECGATKTEPIAKLEHTHTPSDEWTSDPVGHWHSCSGCPEKLDYSEHTENGGVMTIRPTETTVGETTYRCTVCGAVTRTETIPATGTEHIHDFNTEWKYDTISHWHECFCGEKADLSAHTEDGGTVTVQPMETTTGTKTFKCTVCGCVMRTDSIPSTGGVHIPKPTPPSHPASYPDPVVSPVITADRDEPFIVDNRGIEGWEAISEDINVTEDGGIVDVDMNGTDTLPKSIVEDIAGRDIDLVLEMGGGVTWTINGMTVTNSKSTNMKVYIDRGRIPNAVLDTVSEGTYVKELTLKHTGEFGFTPVLTVKIPVKHENKYANLFYYNPKSGEMEFVNFGIIRDGAVKLAFSHASEYAVVVSDAPMGGESVSVAAGSASRSNIIGTFASSESPKLGIIFIAVVGAGILALKKCRQK